MIASLQTPIVVAIFLLAMGFENAVKGLILSVQKFNVSKASIPAIMIVVNLVSLIFGPLYIWSLLASTDCQQSSLVSKITLHVFVISFSYFLLFKAWVVSQKRPWVAGFAFLLIANRCTWAVLDCMWSYSKQIPGGCVYIQDKTSIIGISTGGILVDVFATTTTIVSAFRDVDEDSSNQLQRVYRVLIADNVIRSLLVLAANAFTLNYSMVGTLNIASGSPSILLIIPAISNYVYTMATNLEFFWIDVRKDIMQKS
ncbi:hypothetical protein HDU78_001831 [Chytriomyces hyalinus]|uniref:Uncharacterized protein n=1 Tax=Chytriomyces confervae TaxID=246404 RepID=A0A507FT40_9FUNG|nr:hypothetical protein HDU78_001831 [Chytriomyces hyalinus]KAJ3263317.1 hypothetical protein HDU77_010929 [Chytriomyces hyalinus]KAJ3409499.1 hypothetical protein HDU80_000552 [Chytriomyces hyalinus]TPX78007.1 hypothetical protein CcCBS67573_g00733 [Chytriomyces confervae]